MMFFATLFGWLPTPRGRAYHRPRIVRRVAMQCPHTGHPVHVEFLEGMTAKFDLVLRCTGNPDRPASCDQACCMTAEAALAPVEAQRILPPGTEIRDEMD